MANISIVRGTFVFDFNNCPQQEPSQYNDWLKKVSEVLSDRPYPTNLDLYRDLYNPDKRNAKVPFTAEGAWKYENNINEIIAEQDAFRDLLMEMSGIVVTINYIEYEQSDGFVLNGNAIINTDNGTVSVKIDTESDDFNRENFLNYGCGDIYSWCELTGETPDDFE